ncbi:MAG: hypothetical protein ACOY4L_09140 [Pseudomonadota bacterium]
MDADAAIFKLLIAAYALPALVLLLTGAGLGAALLGALLALPVTIPLAGIVGGLILGARP